MVIETQRERDRHLAPPVVPPRHRQRTAWWRVLGPMAPALVLMAVFVLGPILWAAYGAFTNAALTGAGAAESTFTGLENFRLMLADPVFRESVILTVVFVFGSAVLGQNTLGMLLAILMRGRSRLVRNTISTIVVGAWVVPEVVAGFIWFAFLGDDGTLNQLVRGAGGDGISWLVETPMLAVILANIWRGTAFSMLVYSAALAEVPTELREAAAVDGAGPLRCLVSVVLPLIKNSIATNLMLITLQTLSLFTLIFVMTSGGPGTQTETLPLYMYHQAFKFFQLGYGTAISFVLLVIGALASLLYVRTLRAEV